MNGYFYLFSIKLFILIIFYSSTINLSIYFTLFLTFHFIFNKYKFILYINLITLHYHHLLRYYHLYLKNMYTHMR